MDPALREREIAEIGRASELRFVFASPRLAPTIQAALPRVRVLGLGEAERVDRLVNTIVRQLENMGETEIASHVVGEMVMKALKQLGKKGKAKTGTRDTGRCSARPRSHP